MDRNSKLRKFWQFFRLSVCEASDGSKQQNYLQERDMLINQQLLPLH